MLEKLEKLEEQDKQIGKKSIFYTHKTSKSQVSGYKSRTSHLSDMINKKLMSSKKSKSKTNVSSDNTFNLTDKKGVLRSIELTLSKKNIIVDETKQRFSQQVNGNTEKKNPKTKRLMNQFYHSNSETKANGLISGGFTFGPKRINPKSDITISHISTSTKISDDLEYNINQSRISTDNGGSKSPKFLSPRTDENTNRSSNNKRSLYGHNIMLK